MRNDFVVYAHYTLDTNRLFYIGEGTLKRSKDKSNRNRWWNFKVAKHGFKVKILYNNLTKIQAENIETRLIRNLKKRGSNIVNICIGPMYKNNWILNIPKELHPMYGRKLPYASKRMIEWNKNHSGKNSPVYGLKRPDLILRNKLGNFIRYSTPIICNETGQIFKSIKEATKFLDLPENSTCIHKNLSGYRSHCKNFTWSYLGDKGLINGMSLDK